MPCFSQMIAVRVPGRTKNGKSPMRFAGKASSWSGRAPLNSMLLPCRQCIGCRLEKSRQWATRLMHESSLHAKSCFLTLTYDDDHIPKDGSLNRSHLSTFFKDLRARCDYYGKGKVKYFACGEYGEKFSRPHYHAALFGPFDCASFDSERHEEEPSRSGDRQFSHADLTACWPHGLHRFSELSFESAAYVARYCLKKVSGAQQASHYGDRVPEFQTSSNGLGKGHVERWLSDVYPADHVVIPGRGAFMPPPYYDRVLEKVDPGLYAQVKKAREEAHEKLTSSEWFEHVEMRLREQDVRTLVTKATLIRGVE